MSAVNSLPVTGAVTEKKAYEPSMEEILASIRRIIADDQSLPLRSTREPEPLSESSPERSIEEPVVAHLDEARQARASELSSELPQESTGDVSAPHGQIAAPQFASPDGPVAEPVTTRAPHPFRAVAATSERAPDIDEPVEAPAEEPEAADAEEVSPLASATTDSAVAAAFNMLAASRLADRSDELMGLVREMIRPLLRTWLDENLPNMVERLVRAEIERVARGGR